MRCKMPRGPNRVLRARLDRRRMSGFASTVDPALGELRRPNIYRWVQVLFCFWLRLQLLNFAGFLFLSYSGLSPGVYRLIDALKTCLEKLLTPCSFLPSPSVEFCMFVDQARTWQVGPQFFCG